MWLEDDCAKIADPHSAKYVYDKSICTRIDLTVSGFIEHIVVNKHKNTWRQFQFLPGEEIHIFLSDKNYARPLNASSVSTTYIWIDVLPNERRIIRFAEMIVHTFRESFFLIRSNICYTRKLKFGLMSLNSVSFDMHAQAHPPFIFNENTLLWKNEDHDLQDLHCFSFPIIGRFIAQNYRIVGCAVLPNLTSFSEPKIKN